MVRSATAEVKVEVNHVFRGTLLPARPTPLSKAAEDLFTAELTLPLLDPDEIYGSKLVAAMDRQHPRDIFDVMQMRAKFPLEGSVLDCFVAYLAGHNRPVHEVLFSTDAPIESLFLNHFRGMTADEIQLETLLGARASLKDELPKALTKKHRDFLLSLVTCEPGWDLMPFPHLRDLPAIRWKLENLARLKSSNAARFQEQHDRLADQFRRT